MNGNPIDTLGVSSRLMQKGQRHHVEYLVLHFSSTPVWVRTQVSHRHLHTWNTRPTLAQPLFQAAKLG